MTGDSGDDAAADGPDDRRADAGRAEPGDGNALRRDGDEEPRDDDERRGVGADLGRPVEGLSGSVERLRAGVARGWDAVRAAIDARGPPPLLSVPTTVTDGAGRAVRYRPFHEADRAALVAMYDSWDPADRAQGTPPLGEAAVRAWLDDVVDGPNVVAVHEDATPRPEAGEGEGREGDPGGGGGSEDGTGPGDGRVVGHAMFVPDGTDRHEFAIFVDEEYRGDGVGTTLALAGMGHAAAQGAEYVWLSVEAGERGLQRWYSRLGFSTVNPMGYAHRMSRRLSAPDEGSPDGGGDAPTDGEEREGADTDA